MELRATVEVMYFHREALQLEFGGSLSDRTDFSNTVDNQKDCSWILVF